MKQCLVDVNVWLALLVIQHEHHTVANAWYERLAAGEAGLCRIVHLALIRLLANPSMMGGAVLSAPAAWNVIERLLEDERVEFVPEPAGVDAFFPAQLPQPLPSGKLITDAYLSAFAMAGARRLVTLDRAFRQFHGLDVELLDGPP